MRFLIPLIILLAASISMADDDALKMFSERLAPLAEIRTVQADYIQTRKIKSLDLSLKITGAMALEKNGRLFWHAKSPLSCISIISEDSLRQWDAETGKVITISATRFPWLKFIYSSMSEWMSGDLEKLKNNFQIEVKDDYTLVLVPQQKMFAEFIAKAEIKFSPKYDSIAEMTFFERNGDVLHFEYNNTFVNQNIPEEKWILLPK